MLRQYCLLGQDASVKTCEQRGYVDAKFSGCLSNSEFRPSYHNFSIRSAVRALLDGCGPIAIILDIWPFIVLPFQRMFHGRSLAHVGVEIFEGLPPIADLDAAGAVVFVVRSLWLRAPSSHIDPYSINWRTIHAVPTVDYLRPLAGDFARKTAAAFRDSSLKVIVHHEAFRAAITTAKTFRWPYVKDRPALESFISFHARYNAMEAIF